MLNFKEEDLPSIQDVDLLEYYSSQIKEFRDEINSEIQEIGTGVLGVVNFGLNNKFTKDQQIKLKEFAFVADFNIKENTDYIYNDITILLEDAARFGFEFTVKKLLPNRIVERIAVLQTHTSTVINQRCNVSIAGLGTLQFDTVKVEVDCCTNQLQRELDNGWKILAICVQPDQRRPDYVLGKML